MWSFERVSARSINRTTRTRPWAPWVHHSCTTSRHMVQNPLRIRAKYLHILCQTRCKGKACKKKREMHLSIWLILINIFTIFSTIALSFLQTPLWGKNVFVLIRICWHSQSQAVGNQLNVFVCYHDVCVKVSYFPIFGSRTFVKTRRSIYIYIISWKKGTAGLWFCLKT